MKCIRISLRMLCLYVFILHMKVPGADSGVVRIDPLRFLSDVVKGD